MDSIDKTGLLTIRDITGEKIDLDRSIYRMFASRTKKSMPGWFHIIILIS